MNRTKGISLAASIFALFSSQIAFATPITQTGDGLPEGLYHKDISTALINEVHTLFPERSEVNPQYIAPSLDPNLHFQEDAIATLTFIDEGAGYWNSFGYFVYDGDENILEEHILFGNASEQGGGGLLTPGDSIDFGGYYNSDNTINPFAAGTNVGFFVTPNGWGNPVHHQYQYKFYTLDSLNPDGQRHVGMVYSQANQALIIGMEDVWWAHSDKDVNDILFTITTDPLSALTGIVEEGSVPQTEPVPEPSTMLLFGTGVLALSRLTARKRNC